MKLKILTRRVHYWVSIAVAIPLLVIISTGVLLQLKKNLAWVQPPERHGVADSPTLSLPAVLDIVRAVPEANVREWSDIPRVEYRPRRSLMKVVSSNGTEVQIDAVSGAVLQVARRRSDLIESIHDGSFFHPAAKLWVFLPAGVALLGLLVTGLYLFFLPIVSRRRARQSRGSRT